MKKLLVIVCLVGALLAVLGSCSNDGCLDNKNSLPKAEFLSSATKNAITLNMLKIHGIGAPGDSLLVDSGEAVSTIYLPMRSTANTTAWCFAYKAEGLDHPSLNDTVAFGYESQPYFASDECGAIFRYLITECRTTTHLIDSVIVIDSLITNVDRVRIQIYFRTADEPETDTE